MPNPFQSLGAVPIMATIQDMLQRQANLERTRTTTALEKNRLNLENQQIQLDQEYRDAQLKGILLDPTKNNPSTTSISTSEDVSTDPQQKALKDFRAERETAVQNIQLATKYRQDTKPFLTQLERIDTNIRETSKDVAKAQADKAQQIAQIARDIDSPESAAAAIETVRGIDPNAAAQLARKFPRDRDGNLLFNETAKRNLAPYASQYTSMHERAMQDYRRSEVEIQNRTRDEAERRDKELARFHDQEISVRRAGIAAANKRHEDTLKAAGLKYDSSLVKGTQADLNKLATDYKIGDFRAAADFASGIEAKLSDPARGYVSVTPEEARQLVEQAKRMQQNFRSFGGAGKLQEAEFNRMNSFLEKFEKYIGTVGEGEKILAKDQMLNLTGTMKNVYMDRNAELVKQELQRKKILADRGNNPEWVVGRGDIDALKQSGRAAEVTVNNKQYLAIVPSGKTKKDLTKNDLFEIPQTPKIPQFLEVPTE